MKLFCLLLFIATNVCAADLMICNGEYALCAASPATRDGDKKITVMGKEFDANQASAYLNSFPKKT